MNNSPAELFYNMLTEKRAKTSSWAYYRNYVKSPALSANHSREEITMKCTACVIAETPFCPECGQHTKQAQKAELVLLQERINHRGGPDAMTFDEIINFLGEFGPNDEEDFADWFNEFNE